MRRARRGGVSIAIALVLAASATADVALANGDAQREIQGRVVSVDTRAGRLVVERELRGKTVRLTIRAAPTTPVYACGAERPALDQVRAGMVVSVFYEVLGAEGVANLVVVEPSR